MGYDRSAGMCVPTYHHQLLVAMTLVSERRGAARGRVVQSVASIQCVDTAICIVVDRDHRIVREPCTAGSQRMRGAIAVDLDR